MAPGARASEVATATVATEALPPDEQREPSEWTCAASPPAAYQIYHVWARLKALNGCRGRVNLPALPLTVPAGGPAVGSPQLRGRPIDDLS